MKKTLTLFIAGLISAASAIAQPTLTAATSIPPAGYSYQLWAGNTFAASNSGPNQTWDFTALSYPASVIQTYALCGATNCAPFPGTNLVGNTTGNGGDIYLINSNTAQSIKGIVAGGTSLVYTDPEDLYRFPMTYNSSFVDQFAVSFVSGGTTYYRRGSDSTVVDGYGTLKTPAGTFNNVLRIKRVETYSDSAQINGSPFIITYKSSIYTWNDAAHKDILFTTSTVTTTLPGGGTSTLNANRYTQGQPTTGINEVNGNQFTWNIHPNPAKGQAQVAISLKMAASVQICITDFTGRLVKQMPVALMAAGEHQVMLPLEGMATGMYLVRMNAGASAATAKLVVE